MTINPNRYPVRRTLAAACLAAAALGSPVLAATASAQLSAKVEPVDEPYKIVLTDQRALVRCGPGAAYYPVAESLPNGSILTADGATSTGWLRVMYPTAAAALVDDESVTLPDGPVRPGETVATLNRPAALSAFNASTGARGSWSKLLAEPLPAGTKLTVISEAVNDLTGERVGYQVAAPAQARAFIRESFTRRATSADIAAAAQLDQPAAASDPQPREARAGDPQQADPSQTDPQATEPIAEPIAEPVAENDQPEPIDEGAEPSVSIPAGTPAVATEPSLAEGLSESESLDTVADPVADPGADPAEEPAPQRIETLEDLETAFALVQAQPIAEAEFDQLLVEVDRMLEGLAQGDGLRPAIESRRNVLRIRQRVQEAWRENLEATLAAENAADDLNNEIRRLEIERSYSAIGRLLPSAVYDGKRLPRMYRIQSVDTTEAPRTLGYLKPAPELGLETMLNQTVGVVGTPRLDPRLNLLIIEPVKIDVIGAGG